MERAGVDININKFIDLTARLTGKEMDVAKKAAVRQGANYLRRVTNKAYATWTRLPMRKHGVSGVKKPGEAVMKEDKENPGVFKVHIMGDYMMKWFELGTKERKTKSRKIVGSYRKGMRKFLTRAGKGRNTGKIDALYLFQKAQRYSQKKVFDEMEKRLIRSLKRINKSK